MTFTDLRDDAQIYQDPFANGTVFGAPSLAAALVEPGVLWLARSGGGDGTAAAGATKFGQFAHASPVRAGCDLPILNRSRAESQ